MQKVKLGDLGCKLPIGIHDGKRLIKDFSLRPYKSRIDRYLGDWQEKAVLQYTPGQLLAYKVAKFISLIVAEAGGKALALTDTGDTTPEQELSIHRWNYVDVMYSYIMARIGAMGPDFDVTVMCANLIAGEDGVKRPCGFKGEARFDLRTMDVDILDETDDLVRWVTLRRPLKLREGKTARKIRIGPATFAAMTGPGVMSGNRGAVLYGSVLDAIRGVDCVEGDYQLTQLELDEMERVDTVAINRAAGELLVGADLVTKVECPKCKGTITDSMNWTHDHFFGISWPGSETPSKST